MGYLPNPIFCCLSHYRKRTNTFTKRFFCAQPALKKRKTHPKLNAPRRRTQLVRKQTKRKNRKKFKPNTFKKGNRGLKRKKAKKITPVVQLLPQTNTKHKHKLRQTSSVTKIYMRKLKKKYPKLLTSLSLKTKVNPIAKITNPKSGLSDTSPYFIPQTTYLYKQREALRREGKLFSARLLISQALKVQRHRRRRRRRIQRNSESVFEISKSVFRQKSKGIRGLCFRLPKSYWLVAKRQLKKNYKLRFMRIGKFTYDQTHVDFLKRSKVSRLSEIRTNDFTSLQFVLYFLRKRIAEQARIRAIALAKTKTIFKQQNSKRGLAHYFLALKVFRKRKILKFLKYRNVIVPFLKKRYNIFFKTKHKIYKRYARMRALKTLMLAFLHREQMFTQRAAYRRFLIMQKGLRFMYANLKNSVIRRINIQVRKKKINQLFYFFEHLITLLPAFLVYNYFMPRVLFAKQFIRFGFIAVNGELCQNTNYLVKVKDIVEVDKLYFIKLFIQDDLHDTYRKFLAKKMLLVPGFLYNYRLLILLYAEPLRKTARFHRINRFEFRNFKFRFYRVLFNNLLHYV